MGGRVMHKFSPALARIAMMKAEPDPQCNYRLKNRYTPDQIIEIERRISALRQAEAALDARNQLS
jgi:DTW domain-containing protein YfiP